MSWSDSIKKRQANRLTEHLDDVIAQSLRPPPKLTVSEWADKYRQLSRESSAVSGQWSTSKAEYQRGMMDAVSDPRYETVVLMTCAQIGKTELVNNVLGYHIHQDPCASLVVMPTVDMANAWSKDRLSPAIRDTPVLTRLIADPKSRDSGNTVLHKSFPGGRVTASGANSPASLASRPCRLILMDEVDRFPLSAGSEGDPVGLAKRRSATYYNRKIVLVSTPTETGSSRIAAAYEESDQRKYFVPCPHCGEHQVLKWSNVKWNDGDPSSAHYVCDECGSVWTELDRSRAIRRGEWRATAEAKGKVAGFHLNGIYSPWTRLEDAVQDFLTSKSDPMRLKTFVNTFLGETFDSERGEQLDEMDLMNRAEDWDGDIPEEVLLITAGVDTQDDRLEVELIGWGRGEESYSLAYHTLYGDPSTAELWLRLDDVLKTPFIHPITGEMICRSACVDSGGHYTQQVYNYCRTRVGRRIFAIKGVGGEGRPIVGRPSKSNIGKVNLFPVGVDTAKEVVMARLRIKEPGEGYCHFPTGRSEEYYRMLTSEKRVVKYYKGRPKNEWVKTRTRNEALDCRVYGTAALSILNLNLESLYRKGLRTEVRESENTKRRPVRRVKDNYVMRF
jgi:phage terminase large subunit GpA-like protein